MDSQYQNITDQEGAVDALEAIRGHTKKSAKYIQLQRVESQLKEFRILNYYLTAAFIYVSIKLILDLEFDSDVRQDVIDNKVDLYIRIVQILGYGYGITAFSIKSRLQWKIFCFYVMSSFVIIGYFLYVAIRDKHWFQFGFNFVNIPINVGLLVLARKFYDCLKKRDLLKEDLRGEKAENDHEKLNNMA